MPIKPEIPVALSGAFLLLLVSGCVTGDGDAGLLKPSGSGIWPFGDRSEESIEEEAPFDVASGEAPLDPAANKRWLRRQLGAEVVYEDEQIEIWRAGQDYFFFREGEVGQIGRTLPVLEE